MKENKIKSTLLIVTLLLSTIVGLVVPASMASTQITPKYVFETWYLPGVLQASAGWDATPDSAALYGDYNARLALVAATDYDDYAYVRIYPGPTGITVNNLLTGTPNKIPTFKYWLPTETSVHPDLELRFTSEGYSVGNAGSVDITIYQAPWAITNGVWNPAGGVTGANNAVYYGNKPVTNEVFSGSGTLAEVITSINGLGYGDWKLSRVSPQFGDTEGTNEVYIDNFVIAGVTYDLEPQSLTVGQSYDISWATGYGEKAVALLYTPESLPDISITSTTSAGGVVNFYNVVPHYAGNWTLSDLTDTVPTPVYDEIGLVKMSITGTKLAAYFLVQPAKDLTVSVSPSALDVISGTKALTVTVTSGGSPVGDAYVCVEFWDNEANHLDTPDTALLRSSTIKTASNGVAIFDVEVPKVAGTIFVMAGTDLGPKALDPDGDYFEHWGSKTVPVSSIGAVKISTTPSTFTQGILGSLNITLEDSPSTLLVLNGVDSAGWITVTISGDDIAATEVGPKPNEGSLALKDTDSKLDIVKVYVDSVDKTTAMQDADIATYVTGDVWVIQCRTDEDAKPFQIRLYGFKGTKVGSVVVSAKVDIGGVVSKVLATLTDDKAADGLADYVDTGAKTISIVGAGNVNIVNLTPSSIDALASTTTVDFTVYFVDETGAVKKADSTDYFAVSVTYPTGRSFSSVTDADGKFTMILDDTTATGHYYRADEAGTFSILVSGYKDRATLLTPISGSATILVAGYLVSTDVATIVAKTNNTITITVTNSAGSVINNAKVSMTSSAGTLTATEIIGSVVKIDGTATSIQNGQYVFHKVKASQVCEIMVLVEKGSDDTDMARLYIQSSNPVLTITSTKDPLTSIIDNTFKIRVMNGATPEVGATIELNVSFTATPTTTNSTGYSVIAIDYTKLPTTVTAVRIYVVSSDFSRTGEIVLQVKPPVYVPSEEFYLTAGIDSIGNFTIKSADGAPAIILVDKAITSEAKVHVTANMTVDAKPDGTWQTIVKDTELDVKGGFLTFKLKAGTSCTTAYTKYDALKFTARTAIATGFKEAVVATIPIHNPIVSNTTYTGFPITYTAYVGQSKNFYVKIQDADGVAVEGATIAIIAADLPVASGVTNAAGETTITWTPPSTGTYKLRLNGELDIGAITVKSYVVPKLAIGYSPETAHLNDVVTLTVTVEGAVGGASVTIVDPDGKTISKTTTVTGTCKFTADKVGEWTIYASKTGYTDADPVDITVLARVPVAEYDIALSAGWNLISLPLIPENSTIEAVLTDLDGVEAVWSYEAGEWYSYAPDVPSDLHKMTDGKGYWIEMSASATLTVYGTEMPEDPLAPLPAYPVVVGWNLVGFKETYTMSVSDYLAGVSYARVYEYVGGYHSLSASDLMKPGQGYWIAVTEAGTIYP